MPLYCPELKCRYDWMYDVRTATCYREFKAKLTWADAKDACATNGAVLASIKDVKDQEFLSGRYSKNSMSKQQSKSATKTYCNFDRWSFNPLHDIIYAF